MFRPLFAVAFVFLSSWSLHAAQAAPTAVDWPKFLARQDLIWAKNPASWEEGAFIGNGNLGANIFVQNGALSWEVNRADVYHAGTRYQMGRVALKTAGAITGGEARVDLWNAEARGTLRTDKGEIRWRSFTATKPAVIVIELEGRGGEAGVHLSWIHADVLPPRDVYQNNPVPAEFQHPKPAILNLGGSSTAVQRFKNGGAFAVTLSEPKFGSTPAKKTYYVSVGSAGDPDAATAEAGQAISAALNTGLDRVVADHRAWWHSFYPASFVSFPDARLEAFYWIQIYKLGSAMRSDGPILDLMGPWFRRTPWPKIWWNLNIQLTYAPLMAANRLPLAESLFSALDRNRAQLHANAPEAIRADAAVIGRSSGPDMNREVNLGTANGGAGLEAGNLPWVMFLYHNFYRMQMDDAILRDRVMPLLGPTIGHYLAYLTKDAQGVYHLPKTHSPEFADVPDANYDLGFLRWGLETLIASCAHLKLDDPRLPRWREVLAHLTPFPVDETGLMIGRGKNLDKSHRHYSHLVSIYPLHLLTPDDPANRALTEKSLAHWFSQPEAHKGYSNTGAASMHAMLGNGNSAAEQLNLLLNTWIHPNTLYTEAGPVIETPLSALCSVHEMFLQDWGGKLRVLSAIPDTWADASFATLRAEGAFLVSGVRREGKNAWVKIESLAGAPCRVSITGWTTAVVRDHSGSARAPKIAKASNGDFVVELPKGASVILAPSADSPLPALSPVETPAAAQNPYAERPGKTRTMAPLPGVGMLLFPVRSTR